MLRQVFGDDPTVKLLEEKVAVMLGPPGQGQALSFLGTQFTESVS